MSMASASLLRVSTVDDRLPSEFCCEPRVVLAKISLSRHRAATRAIAKPGGTQRSCDVDARSVTPSIAHVLVRARKRVE
jgi:hypothetical protein